MSRSASVQVNHARLATQLGVILYVMLSIAYLGFGQANADEGWYLYASQLVFHNALPYRDFAYTQMPLLPYIYGVFQIVHPSLFLGRLTSIVISAGTLGMSLVIARRYGGWRAAGITALILGSFTYSIYFNSIVKTYALVTFCFTATLFVLSSNLSVKYKYPLALLYACAAALIRLTAVFFLAPIILYILSTAPRRVRLVALGEGVVAGGVAGFFLLPDWGVASWNLLGSHLSHWGDSQTVDQLKTILTERLPAIAQNYAPILVLCVAVVYVILSRNRRAWQRIPGPLLAASAGLVLFAASHLANGIWEAEYLVPAMTALVPILAIALSRFYAQIDSLSQSFFRGALVACMILMPFIETTQHTDLTGGRLPLDEIGQVAAMVAQNSQPADKVLVMEALYVIVQADRTPLPGMTLAQFSLQNVDTPTAQQLHVVNYQLISDAITNKTARVIVMTDGDWNTVNQANPSNQGTLQNALTANYRQVFTMSDFGQYSQNVFVYVSR